MSEGTLFGEHEARHDVEVDVEVDVEGDVADPALDEREPDWWHSDHPTFTAITGFFTGLVLVTLAPGLFVATISKVFSERAAEEAFPFVLLLLAIPIALLVFPRSRRFARYLLFGMVVTLLVVFGVGTVVFWLMMNYST